MRRAPAENRLLAVLPRKDRRHLLAGCEEIDLRFGDVLSEPGERFRYVYFPTEGFLSLLLCVHGRQTRDVKLVGNEGMLGVPLALGVTISPLRALVQGSGSALRMSAATFRRELELTPALRRMVNRYIYVLMAQLSQAAACIGSHLLDARLARSLLTTHDRALSREFHLTHEFLAQMLGVRRVGVTNAAGLLQRRKLVSYSRGDITILDRAGLEAASCECYRGAKDTYRRILG
jgi:CRP-like cAMP-binding protein